MLRRVARARRGMRCTSPAGRTGSRPTPTAAGSGITWRGRPAIRWHRVNGQVSYDWRGDTLIVAQLDYTGRWTVRSDLWRWTPDGAWTQLTAGARLMEPRAGGGVLAMLVLSGGDEGPTVGPLTRDATWGPAVPSPDGRWIVAPRNQNGRWALVRWRTGTPAPVDVLAQAAAGSVIADPVWSQDGSVLFVMDAGGFPQIHRWREGAGGGGGGGGGGSITQLTEEPLGARAPAPLPDGRIAFAPMGNDGWELPVASPVALTPRPVTLPASVPFDPPPTV